jgi:flagellar hook-basal body complex protein FliE
MAIETLVGTLQPLAPEPGRTPDGGGTAPTGFGASLERFVSAVESSNADANRAVGRMVEGSGDVHDAMIALQRAELTLQLTVQVRNKLVQAYQDIMRMPV